MNVFGQFSFIIGLALISALCALIVMRRVADHHAIRLSVAARRRRDFRWADRIFFAEFLAFVFIFSLLPLLRYASFHTGYLDVNTSWDLAQYDQIIWNSLHGRLFQNSFILDANTFLGKSFTPILIAFVPMYAVWSSPIVLLIAQTLGVAFSAFPIYWFARAQVGSAQALALCTAFFLSPGAENIVLAEFHEIAFAAPVLALAAFFLLRRHYAGLLVSLAVAILIKEEIALVVVGFGLYVLLVQRKRWLGLALTGFGIAWAIVLLQYVIPYFRGVQYGSAFYYFGSGQIGSGGVRYSYLGQSIPEIARTVLTRPDIVWSHVVVSDKLEYLLHLFVPLAFVPFVGAEVTALAVPTLGYSLLSTYGLQYSIHSYYFAPLFPFLFIGAAVGMRRIAYWTSGTRWFARNEPDTKSFAVTGSLSILILVASGATYLTQSPGPLGGDFQSERYQLNEHTKLGNELLSLIPDGAEVVAQNEYLAHLSRRQQIYEVPIPDYRQVEYFFADRSMKWFNVHIGQWEYYLGSGYFQILADQDGYLVGKHIAPQQSLSLRFNDAMTLLGYATKPDGVLKGGMTFRPVVFWRAETPIDLNYKIAVQVVDAQGHLWAEEDREPGEGSAPTGKWELGQVVGDQYSIKLPPTMPTGDYQIAVRVHRDGGPNLPASDTNRAQLNDEPIIAQVRIEKDKSSVVASDLVKEQPMAELFADMREMRFLGYYPFMSNAEPGKLVHIGLYWRARSKPSADYVFAAQLRDSNGSGVFEHAAQPANSTYPTTTWDPGEVLLDWHDFQLPASVKPGLYEVFAVLRDARTMQELGEIRVTTLDVVGQ